MHVPDHVVDPTVCLAAASLSAAATGFAIHRVRKNLSQRDLPLMGVVAAGVFAAQMLNFQILPGVSGHILGGALAGIVLGPWAAMLVMSVVLTVQCLLFQDGGVTALGVNLLNMAIVPPLLGFALYQMLRKAIGGLPGAIVAALAASWVSVVVAAALCSVELSMGRAIPFTPLLRDMLFVHSIVGLGEALLGGVVLVCAWNARASFVRNEQVASGMNRTGLVFSTRRMVAAGLCTVLIAAMLLSPLASSLPDALEATLTRQGISAEVGPAVWAAPFAGYQLSLPAFQQAAGPLAAGLGTLVVFFVATVLGIRPHLLAKGQRE